MDEKLKDYNKSGQDFKVRSEAGCVRRYNQWNMMTIINTDGKRKTKKRMGIQSVFL